MREGVPVEVEIAGRSLKAALKRADRDGFRVVAMLGDDELAAGTVTVRDLAAGSQTSVAVRGGARLLAAPAGGEAAIGEGDRP